MSHPGRRAGFTIVELIIASLIFSMVIAGLAVIYTTALNQTGIIVMSTKVQAMGNVSWRAFSREVPAATVLFMPVKDGFGSFLTGCNQNAPNGVDFKNFIPGTPLPRSFAFCVQPGAINGCPDANSPVPGIPPNPQGCLFYYNWPANAACYNPVINAGNCGTTINNATAVLIASLVENNPVMPGAYFSRAAANLALPNGVRVAYQLRRSPTKAGQATTIFVVDEILSAQFNPGIP